MDRDQHTPGVKLDTGKSPIIKGALQYFPRALKKVAEHSAKGAEKYTWAGYLEVEDGYERYTNALGRHLTDEAFSLYDEEGSLHPVAAAWNALARLELFLITHEIETALVENPEGLNQLELNLEDLMKREGTDK